jgi:hypothetical protein
MHILIKFVKVDVALHFQSSKTPNWSVREQVRLLTQLSLNQKGAIHPNVH